MLQKKNEAMKSGEEKDKDEENETKKEDCNTPTISGNNNQPTGTPTRNIRPSSRVLQPPGGASTTSLW